MTRTGVILRSYIGVVVMTLPIFLGAGRWAFVRGWAYVALAVVGTTLSHLLSRGDPDLTVDRATRAREGESWDRRLLLALFVTSEVMYLVAGFDAGRFGWTGEVPLWIALGGSVAMLGGQLLFALARRENAFFSSTVRLQRDRGHVVCETGPYRIVRHPGYLGLLLSILAFPFVLGSAWSSIPALVAGGVLVMRAAREDAFLLTELSGYEAFSARTRWRLLPGLF